MITKGCGVLGLIAAAMMFPWTLHYASAADFVQVTKEVKLHPKAPVSVNGSSPVNGKIQLNEKFSSINSICFRFLFVDDILDPGEQIIMYFSDNTGVGNNVFTEPKSDFGICVAEPLLSLLLDGKEDVRLLMGTPGSVTLNSLSITVSGYSR